MRRKSRRRERGSDEGSGTGSVEAAVSDMGELKMKKDPAAGGLRGWRPVRQGKSARGERSEVEADA